MLQVKVFEWWCFEGPINFLPYNAVSLLYVFVLSHHKPILWEGADMPYLRGLLALICICSRNCTQYAVTSWIQAQIYFFGYGKCPNRQGTSAPLRIAIKIP